MVMDHLTDGYGTHSLRQCKLTPLFPCTGTPDIDMFELLHYG